MATQSQFQNDLVDTVKAITTRDWLTYQKAFDMSRSEITQDTSLLMVILSDQKYLKDSSRHDIDRFLDMTDSELISHLGLDTVDADE